MGEPCTAAVPREQSAWGCHKHHWFCPIPAEGRGVQDPPLHQGPGQHPLCQLVPFPITVRPSAWDGPPSPSRQTLSPGGALPLTSDPQPRMGPLHPPPNVTSCLLLIFQHLLLERLQEPQSQRFRPPGPYNPTTFPSLHSAPGLSASPVILSCHLHPRGQ